MIACPNKSSKDWKNLVSKIGEFEAVREYLKLGTGEIPSVYNVLGFTGEERLSKIESPAEVRLMKEETANNLIEFLNDKFPGLKGAVINDKEQKWKGKLVDGKIPTINIAYAEMSDGFHEFAHPFLMSLRKSNLNLFNNLYENLQNTPEWETIKALAQSKVERLYPELTGANPSLFKEEVLATAIGYAAERKSTETQEKVSKNLGRIIDDIFKWLNEFIIDLFSISKQTAKLSPTTTFAEIIDMMTDTETRLILDADWTKLVENSWMGDAMVEAITTNQESVSEILTQDLSNAMVADQKLDIETFVNQWLDKTFKLPKKDYKPRKVDSGRLAYNMAQNMLQAATQKGYQLRGINLKFTDEKLKALPYSGHTFTEDTIEKLASVLEPIELNYKFANYLTNKKNIAISLKQPFVVIKETLQDDGFVQETASIPMTVQEARVVQDFQADLLQKYPDRKSMSADQINDEYIQWVTNNYGINWTEAIGHVGYGMDRIQNSGSKLDGYTRILFVDDYFNQNGHNFQIKGTNLSGNGIGWYVKAEIDGDRFDHEFQSDILPEITKSFKKGDYEDTEGRKLKKTGLLSRHNEVRNLTMSKLTNMMQASSDFLIARTHYLMDQIEKLDDENIMVSVPDITQFDQEDEFVDFPFSKIDNIDAAALESDRKFLLSELDVQIDELKQNNNRWSNILYQKGFSKIYNLWLSRKSDAQIELFNWIKTFEIVETGSKRQQEIEEMLDPGEWLPFSKTEDSQYRKKIGFIRSQKREEEVDVDDLGRPLVNVTDKYYDVYATEESIKKFPNSLKKILDQNNEWANSGAPLKPSVQTEEYFRNSLYSTAVQLLDPRTLEIRKNYGYNKTKIKTLRDNVKITLNKNFKAYKFNMGRLKGLEFRKEVYSNSANLVRIAEYYKGQYNRLYKFYNSLYEEAKVIAESQQATGVGKDANYIMYKKYNDLYNNWFNIIVPQSINSAKAEGRTHYYLPTAAAMNAVEGNSRAEDVYWTPSDSDQINNKKLDDYTQRVNLISKYVSQNTPEVSEALRPYLTMELIKNNNLNQNSSADEIANVIALQTSFHIDSQEFKDWIASQSPNTLARPNGPLYNALVKYARKNNIKLTFEKPGWSKHALIKVDLTKYEAKPIDRFSKIDPFYDAEIEKGPAANSTVLTNTLPTEEQQKKQIGTDVVNEMANMLVQNFGVSFSIVTADEARQMTKDIQVPWNGEPAFFFNGRVYFTQEGFTMENVLHEYAHPLLDCLHTQNTKLFDKLLSDFLATPEGAEVLSDVLAAYKEDIDPKDPRFAKEIMARALAKEALNNIENKTNSKEFKSFLDKLLFNIKQLLRKVFGTSVKVEKLSTKTTLKELAEMLRGEKFDINTDLITHSDYVEFARNVDKEAESFRNIENNTIAKAIRSYYKLLNSQISQTQRHADKYSDAIELLVNDQTGMNLLEEARKTIENAPELKKEVTDISELELREQNVTNFIYGMQRFDLISLKVLDHLDKIINRSDSVEKMNDVFYYDLLARNWSKFLEESQTLLKEGGMSGRSEFGQIMSRIKDTLNDIQNKIQKAYGPGVVKVLTEHLQPLAEGIDEHYKKRIEDVKNKGGLGWGNKQNLIDKLQKEWDDTKLTEQRVSDLLFGRAGDTNALSFWTESFLNSPDPIVGGFAVFVKNQLTTTNAEFQQDSNEFIREMAPLLEAAGYSMSDFTKLMSEVSFVDSTKFYNSDTDTLEDRTVWTFLNEFKGVNTILRQYKHDYDKALAEGNKEEADRILKETRQHKKDYFHRNYVDAYYNRQDVYDSLEKNPDLEDAVYKILGVDKSKATAAQKTEAADLYDKAAKEAYRIKNTILNQIQVEDGANFIKEEYDEVTATKKELWKQYTQMASLTNLSGDLKTGEELLTAMIEKKYRKVTREFYEWVPIEGQFEFNLNNYEQKLINEEKLDPKGPEFKEKRDKWIKDNTVVKYTQEYYDDRNQVLSDIRAIMDRIEKFNPQIRKRIDSSLEMEEFLDIAMGYRDTDGQIMGNDISERGKERIKELQQKIIDKKDEFAGLSGLTRQEEEELGELFDKLYTDKKNFTTQERIRMDELLDRKSELGVDRATKTELTKLYRKLFQIQSKEATDYYVDILNNWLGKMGEPEMVDNFTADNVLRPDVYTDLLNKDPEFKKWFEKNHVKKEIFDYNIGDNGAYVTVYERLFIWNRTRPNDPKYYETTKLENGEVIDGVPNLSFFKRKVKDKYTTEKVVGKTVDNKGNWLPKTIAQGAKADSPYINQEYEKLKKSNPAAFKVLEKMKEYHLKWQEDTDLENRLYLQAPRYSITAGENLTLGKKVNQARRWFLNIKNLFNKSAVNIEQLQLNYMLKNQLIEVESIFDEDRAKVPVTGLADIDHSQVSMDFLDGILKYRHGVLRQKTLLDSDPFAQALNRIVKDPKNLPIETNKFSKHFLKGALASLFPSLKEWATSELKKTGAKKTQSVRAKAIDFFYNREFKGQRIVDGTADLPWIWRIYKFTSGITSKAAFAWNIPSALKNRNAAIVQAYIESGGGRFLSFQSIALGKPTAILMMADLGVKNSIYSYKNKSLNVQLMQIFNVGQDFLDHSLHKHFGRSIKDDFANLSFLMSPRKYLQMEATLEIFCGMLNHIKVEQKTKFGKNEIRYADAWEIRNGQIELKDGIDKEYAPGGKKFNTIVNQIHQVSENLEGNYAKISQPMIDSYFIGKLGIYMKKFFTSMGLDHVAGKRTSASLGTVKTGSYSAFLNMVSNLFKYGPQYLVWMGKDQATGVRKTLMHIGSVILMNYLLRRLWGYDDDDLKKTKAAIEKRSGDTFSKTFNTVGWLENQALVVTLGTLTETETWSNPDLLIPQLKNQYLSWGPIYDRGIKMPWQITKHALGAVAGKKVAPSAFYSRDVGPYWWQKKGAAKVWADIGNLTGFTGNTMSPVKQVEALHNVRKGKSQY